MKNVFKKILQVILLIYFIVVTIISVLVIKENKYGITTFGNKYLVVIDKENENNNYKNGDLIIIKNKNINNIKTNEEIFLYNSSINNEVTVKIGRVNEVSLETEPKFITVSNDIGYYREDSIIGEMVDKYSKIGKIIRFLEHKWVFLLLLVVPTAILLLFELYIIIKRVVKNKRIKGENNEEE